MIKRSKEKDEMKKESISFMSNWRKEGLNTFT